MPYSIDELFTRIKKGLVVLEKTPKDNDDYKKYLSVFTNLVKEFTDRLFWVDEIKMFGDREID
jgi:hypothetical protein